MIESLFKDLPPLSTHEADERNNAVPPSSESSGSNDSDDSLLAALPATEKIVRRKILSSLRDDGASADVVQAIVLRLLKWRDKFRDKSGRMSPDEWQSYAARTAYNEINRHFAREKSLKEAPLEDASAIASRESVEADSNAEVFSLVRFVWQEICRLSLRQRRALLLHSQQLIVYLLQSGIADEELARVLDFNESEWREIKIRLPLSDSQIARLARGNDRSIESLTKSIKKARHEARNKLQKLTRG